MSSPPHKYLSTWPISYLINNLFFLKKKKKKKGQIVTGSTKFLKIWVNINDKKILINTIKSIII